MALSDGGGNLRITLQRLCDGLMAGNTRILAAHNDPGFESGSSRTA